MELHYTEMSIAADHAEDFEAMGFQVYWDIMGDVITLILELV